MSGLVFVLLGLALTLAACGSSGAGQDEIDRARTEGAKEAHQQLKIKQIQHQLKELKHGHGTTTSTGTSAPSPSSATSSGGGSSCGGSLSVGPNTTCGFAVNVESDYFSQIGSGAGTVYSYSPTTGKTYSMYCTAGEPHQCTGGNNASVYFP
jgi:hypothetical protein